MNGDRSDAQTSRNDWLCSRRDHQEGVTSMKLTKLAAAVAIVGGLGLGAGLGSGVAVAQPAAPIPLKPSNGHGHDDCPPFCGGGGGNGNGNGHGGPRPQFINQNERWDDSWGAPPWGWGPPPPV